MPDPLNWVNDELQSLERKSLLRHRREVIPHLDGRCEFQGQTLWNFSGNDYLGLANHPAVLQAAASALESGLGARASALITGRTPWHVALESKLAKFKHAESALIFPTGHAVNTGTIPALVGREDVIYCDRLNHASLIDGARQSQAKFRVYRHADVAALRHDMQKVSGSRRRLIITDSLFSMDGDIAPLTELVALAEEFEAMLLVDEAHATGIFGPGGGGLVEEFNLSSPHLICMGTLSKAIGGQGGFVAGSKSLCDYLWNTARPGMFSTALSPPLCAGAFVAIEVIQQEPHRREWVLKQSTQLQLALKDLGWEIPKNVRGPIIPIIVGDAQRTLQLADQLQTAGILVAAIRPPTVPKGTSRLRISLSYAHGQQGAAALIDAFSSLKIR